jgi:hypothetical protein
MKLDSTAVILLALAFSVAARGAEIPGPDGPWHAATLGTPVPLNDAPVLNTQAASLQPQASSLAACGCPTCPNGRCPYQPSPYQPSPYSAPAAQTPVPAVARIRVPDANGRGTSYGSGSLIDVTANAGLVITNNHVVKDGNGQCEVDFPNGGRYQGKVLAADAQFDVAAIVIAAPAGIRPLAIAEALPQRGEQLAIAGYGPDGQYRQASGALQGFVSEDRSPAEFLDIQVGARHGDSGGPIFNSQGQLAGMLNVSNDSITCGPCCQRIRTLLRGWFGRGGTKVGVGVQVGPVQAGVGVAAAPAAVAPAAVAPAAVAPLQTLPPATAPPAAATPTSDPNVISRLQKIQSSLDTLGQTAAQNGSTAPPAVLSGLQAINAAIANLAGGQQSASQQLSELAPLKNLQSQLQTALPQIQSQINQVASNVTPQQLQTVLQDAAKFAPAIAAAAAPGGLSLASILGLVGAGGATLASIGALFQANSTKTAVTQLSQRPITLAPAASPASSPPQASSAPSAAAPAAAASSVAPSVSVAPTAPQPAKTQTVYQQVPVQTNRQTALEMALNELVRRNPNNEAFVTQLSGMADQYESGLSGQSSPTTPSTTNP